VRLYLDDDTVETRLIILLRDAGHDVEIPADTHSSGRSDSIHLTRAIREWRVLMSKNYRDFKELHNLVLAATGHHPGILMIRQDQDTRDLKPPGIVRALHNLIAAGIKLDDDFVILNTWR